VWSGVEWKEHRNDQLFDGIKGVAVIDTPGGLRESFCLIRDRVLRLIRLNLNLNMDMGISTDRGNIDYMIMQVRAHQITFS
jgi:hypothetical protein